MPAPYAIESFHGTLTSNVVATINFTMTHTGVEVLNVDGTAAMYVRLDGVDPTVGGANTLCVPAFIGSVIFSFPKAWPPLADQTVQVRVIATGTPTYHITGVDQ